MSQAHKDHWSTHAYAEAASFVPLLTSKIFDWLAPHSEDDIVDIGCGDGQLTAKIASKCRHVLALDASQNLVSTASSRHRNLNNSITWEVHDCRHLDVLESERWDKIFSNAAMHWILRDETCRTSFFGNVHRALRHGGIFVFEMGGAGNVAEVHCALLGALRHRNIPIELARRIDPWFFPSETMIRELLIQANFEIDRIEVEYRPTRLGAEGSGNLEAWVRLMGAQFLDCLSDDDAKRNEAIEEICEVLASICKRDDEGLWIGYVRLRARVRKRSIA